MPILLQDGSDHDEGEEAEGDEEEDEMEVDSSDESVSEEEKGTMLAFILMCQIFYLFYFYPSIYPSVHLSSTIFTLQHVHLNSI